ncbi:hypothetical protein CLU96_1254 [Chryseobacterium sp. 52]|uniref:hypothetical protein n=1 Tax=Chryseobacterium sp. 52 TaxID=2035213 RepID=UPI000C199FD3|nr:hypothetical protein [Chryseobacterium sp. 52]PIF44311.1 hypothetical protein CLU96_1254 [Chryseobacterium sp. 52]
MNFFKWKNKSKQVQTLPIDEEPLPEISLESVSVEDFRRMIKYGKASNHIAGYKSEEFINLKYGVIKIELPKIQSKGLIIEQVNAILASQYENVDLKNVIGNDVISFLIWIKQQQEFIYEVESNHLASDPDPDMILAGIQRLNKYGDYVTLDSLADNKLIHHEKIYNMPYWKVYEKLKVDKERREIEKAYGKVIEQKHKNKH